jgi:SulP family sulfate permease
VAVLLVTFFLTVLIDLTVAIQAGVVMAAFLFTQRMSDSTQVNFLTESLKEEAEEDPKHPRAISPRLVPEGVEVFEIYGSLFFGAIERFKDAMRRLESHPRILILRMRHVPAIDASGLQALESLLEQSKHNQAVMMLTGVASQPLDAMERSGFVNRLGRENLMDNIDAALQRSRDILGLPPHETRVTTVSLNQQNPPR